MNSDLKNIVYSKDVVEFVTVAVQYCGYLENFEGVTLKKLTDQFCKFLPLIYLKASMLPDTEPISDSDLEITVTEEHYNFILSRLYNVFEQEDTYLEVFLDDMKYSETPIAASISEDLSDIYQDLKNFITVYERGIEENMNDALLLCTDNFKEYWGQKLTNVLRALHSIRYKSYSSEFDDGEIVEEDLW